MRALFLAHPDAPEGPELVDASGSVVATDLHGRVVARTTALHRSDARSLRDSEASLLPSMGPSRSRHGPETTAARPPSRFATTLEVTLNASAPRRAELLSVASLVVGPPRVSGETVPNPSLPSLDVRIAGGVCVPETTCGVFAACF